MGAVNVKAPVRAMHLLRLGMYPVHHDMDVQIGGVFVNGIERLMLFPLHELEKILNGKVHLFRRGLFSIFPAQNPMRDRHLALDRLFSKGDHFVLLRGTSCGEKIQRARECQLFLSLFIVAGEDVIHKFRNHTRLGLAEVCALHLFDDHSRLILSMASLTDSSAISIFGRAC